MIIPFQYGLIIWKHEEVPDKHKLELFKERVGNLLSDFAERLLDTTNNDLDYLKIINIVFNHFKLSYKHSQNNKIRTRDIVRIRQLAMYFGRKYTTLSLADIGSPFGKEHATVIHSVKLIENMNFRYETEISEKDIFLIEKKILNSSLTPKSIIVRK